MGVGYSGAFAINIDTDDIKKLKLKSYDEFLKVMDEQGVNLDEFANFIYDEQIEHILQGTKDISDLFPKEETEDVFYKVGVSEYNWHKVSVAYRNFVNDFEEKQGIAIRLNYHNSDDCGDRYDEVYGAFFCLDFCDVFQQTDNANKLEALGVFFDIAHFVVFG